jgi:myosin heavy subunit
MASPSTQRRSVSRGNNAGGDDPTDEVATLREETAYLELKLKYVQSVSTIFRQKVAVLLRDVWGSPQRQSRVAATASSDVSAEQVHHALRELMSEMESAEKASPAPSLAHTDRGDYWRERFLRAMEDTRPTSLQEAQTLCGLLQERNETADREEELRRQYDVVKAELLKMKESYLRVLDNKAMSAEEAVVERYKHKEAELLALRPTGATAADEHLDALQQQAQRLEQKNRVLRLRNAQAAKDLDAQRKAAEDERHEHSVQLTELVETAKELRAKCALRDADARRAEAGRAIAERSVVLKDATIERLESKIAALELEVAAVLKEGTGNLATNEAAILRRQMDSFELKLRDMEAALRHRDDVVERLERESDVLRETIDAQKLQIDAKQRLADTFAKRLQALSINTVQREDHAAMLRTLDQRMHQAVTDIAARQNPAELAENVRSLQVEVTKLESLKKTLEAKEEQNTHLTKAVEAFRAEFARCVKLNRAPNLDFVDTEIVKSTLAGTGALATRGEVVLRSEGKWKEVRDLASGQLFYVTEDATATPFKPTKIQPPRKLEPLPKSASSNSVQPSAASSPGAEALDHPRTPRALESDVLQLGIPKDSKPASVEPEQSLPPQPKTPQRFTVDDSGSPFAESEQSLASPFSP